MKRYVKENICGVEAYSPVDRDGKVVPRVALVTILPKDAKVIGEIKGWKEGRPIVELFEESDK